MATCGAITAGASYDCDNPLQPGVNPRVWLINKDDIASTTVGSNASVITAMTLKATKAAYAFEGMRQSVDPQVQFVPQTFAVGYDHILNIQVFDISSTQKLNLEKMALGKMVAIVENANVAGNDDSVFEVFGLGVGMEVVTLTRLSKDSETMGSFSIGLKTSDNEGKEAKLPLSFWNTNYATTLAAIEALE